jgi:hypothetical protein
MSRHIHCSTVDARFRSATRRDDDVEVHAVLGRLGLGDPLEEELRTGPVSVDEDDVVAGGGDLHVVERSGPEVRQAVRVDTVQDKADGRHDASIAQFPGPNRIFCPTPAVRRHRQWPPGPSGSAEGY